MPDRGAIPDAEVVRMVRDGDTDAYAELVRRTQRAAYRLARRITRNHEDADDVVQESYLKAYRALQRFDLSRTFGPWLLTIVARSALSHRRRSAVRTAASLDDPAGLEAIPLAERIADPGGNPDAAHRMIDVERAFDRLSEEHRAVLALRVEADLPYAEIADALEIPIGTVMSRLARAREALLGELKKMEGEVGR